jgi:hypothetical protein
VGVAGVRLQGGSITRPRSVVGVIVGGTWEGKWRHVGFRHDDICTGRGINQCRAFQEETPGRDCYLPLPYEHHNPHPQWYLRVLNSDAEIASIPKCPLHSR